MSADALGTSTWGFRGLAQVVGLGTGREVRVVGVLGVEVVWVAGQRVALKVICTLSMKFLFQMSEKILLANLDKAGIATELAQIDVPPSGVTSVSKASVNETPSGDLFADRTPFCLVSHPSDAVSDGSGIHARGTRAVVVRTG